MPFSYLFHFRGPACRGHLSQTTVGQAAPVRGQPHASSPPGTNSVSTKLNLCARKSLMAHLASLKLAMKHTLSADWKRKNKPNIMMAAMLTITLNCYL